MEMFEGEVVILIDYIYILIVFVICKIDLSLCFFLRIISILLQIKFHSIEKLKLALNILHYFNLYFVLD